MLKKLLPFSQMILAITLIAATIFGPASTTISNATESTLTSNTASSTNLANDEPSYLMLDVKNRSILLEQNADLKRAPASTTKLLTALVAMETLNESDEVEVKDEVLMEESGLHLRPGDKITVENLLIAMFLASANDAAAALAVAAAGSIDDFAQAMNDYAQNLGCTNSHFVNPHGLDDSDHYSTASDLTKIALNFLEHPELMKYTRMEKGTVVWQRSSGEEVSLQVQNTNWLLNKYPGDEGLKTGTTTKAGQCLITYVSRPDGDVVLTLLGSKQRFSDTIDLLDEGYAKLRIRAALKNIASDPQGVLQNTGLYGP